MSKIKSRRIVSILLAIAMLITLLPINAFAENNAVAVFSDVKDTDYYAQAAKILNKLGVLNGYPDGTYRAESFVTRAEMAAIVCRMIDKETMAEKSAGKTDFDDVPENHWASGYINIASKENIIEGDGDGKFRPEDSVIYEEAIKMIICALELDIDITVDEKDWSQGYLEVADENGITDNLKGKKGDIATRGDIAVMSYNGLITDLVAPTASLEAGSYTGTKSVTLSTTTKNADIYYTVDGSVPTIKSTKYTKAISISKTSTLKAITVKKDILISDLMSVEYTITRSVGGGGLSSPTTYTVSFDLNYEGATGAPANQTVKKGEYALRPENPERTGFQFIGWFENKNETDWKNTFDFTETAIQSNMILYGLWVDITLDSDGDGLSDELETYIKTNKNIIDTDGDGLSDYQEVVDLGTDPLKADTDGDGVSDYDEDQDGDALTNGYEYSIGTNPTNEDTDNDLLNDNEEVTVYYTSPIKSDTDGDGAEDGWEIENNYDPKTFNTSFEVSKHSEDVSSANPVAASVQLALNGNQVNSLSVTPVSVADNPYISESIPGYLGTAYDFYVDGDISSARLTFEYDDSIGVIGADFLPRIYYFNDETKSFEELENQTVENGVVTATTTHFSTYILLNKIEFEEVWNADIKPPIAEEDGSEATLDMAFVIDYSASMDDNDPQKLFKKLTKEFVDKLRDGKDKATVIKFIRRATLVSELTTDKEQLNTAIDSIYYDDGYGSYSGTDGSVGYKMALDELSKSDSKYKYIVLITDGEDNGYSYNYDDLIAISASSNVIVYTIGMGSASESVLKKIAQGTNGKYYHATTGSASGDILDLDSVFNDIQEETIDKTTDSNADGIPDYYTELIKNGSLVLSNGSDEFKGIDFNYDENGDLSDDYDGDGLTNGEEIQVVYRGNKVYLVMKSNPMLVHSDRDGIDDKTEAQNGTDPLVYQIWDANAKQLYGDEYYYYASAVHDFDEDWFWKADTAFLAAIFGVWNKDELYRDIIIDYFSNYADNSYVEGLETEQTRKTMIESLSSLISDIKTYGTAPYGEIKKITQLISKINGTTDSKTIHYLLISTYKEIIEEVCEINPKLGEIKITTYSMKSQTARLVNLNAINDKVGKACKAISYISYGIDVVDTITQFSKVSANAQAFENNIDILTEIKNNSSDDHAKDAANAIINKLAGSYGDELLSLGGDALEITGKELISALSKANVYVLAVVAVRDGIDIITGISKDLKQHYQMICYERMTTAIGSLFDDIVTHQGSYYYVDDNNIENLNRYLINLAQLRILGEKKYCEWQKDEGMIGWFTDNSQTEKVIEEQISAIKGIISSLGLTISNRL